MTTPLQFSNKAPEYWHSIANRCFKKFEPSKIQEKVEEIKKKVGIHSYETPAGPQKLTPGHVAVLRNNIEAFKVFLANGIWLTRKDGSGKSIGEYIAQHVGNKKIKDENEKGYEWTQLFHLPRVANSVGMEVLQGFMKENVVPLEKKAFTYHKNSDDFGLKINKILFSNCKINFSNFCTLFDIPPITKYLGIELLASRFGYFPRDYWFRNPSDGGIMPPIVDNKIEKTIQKAIRKTITFGLDGFTQHPHPYLQSFPGNVDFRNLLVEDRIPVQSSPITYFGEGGNQFIMTNKEGETVLLIARFQKDATHLKLRKEMDFKEKAKSTFLAPQTEEKIEKAIKQMYAQGLFEPSGLISLNELKALQIEINLKRIQDWPDLSHVPKVSDTCKLIKRPLKMPSKISKKLRESATNFLRQKKVVREMISETYGLSEKNVSFLPSLFYHLDLFLLPGPSGHCFLVDFDLTLKLLINLKENAKVWELSPQDIQLLDDLIVAYKSFAVSFGPVMKKIQKCLDKVHVGWIPTPGLFLYDCQSLYLPKTSSPKEPKVPNRHVNFFNAVTGFSEKTQKYFYIVEGAKLGDHLGELFMDAFTIFLKTHIPNIDVFFVGRNHQNPADYQESMDLNTELQAGLHCMTFTLESETHIDKAFA